MINKKKKKFNRHKKEIIHKLNKINNKIKCLIRLKIQTTHLNNHGKTKVCLMDINNWLTHFKTKRNL